MTHSKTMIYIVRHGETDWNLEEKMQGHTDIPLNAKGISQAQDIARDLQKIPLDIIYSSPLSRALETATIINTYHKAKIITDNALRERRFGELEGKTYKEINAYHPALLFHESWNFPHYRPPDGESVNDIKIRVSAFAQKMLKENQGKSFLIVAHGVTLRILIGSFIGIPPDQLTGVRIKNAALTIIEISKGIPTLHVINWQAAGKI